MESSIAKADRLGRRRTRIFPVLAVLLLSQQASFIAEPATGTRAVDWVTLGGWVVLTGAILLLLVNGGGWLHSREVRALMNDESTRQNRRLALLAGFVITIVMTMVCYVVTFFEPVDARTALHVIATTGLAGALLRFAALERRAFRDA